MTGPGKITGIILSGGKSSRMGMEKGLCLLHGKPLIEHVIDAVSPFCDHIIISANHPMYNRFGYQVIPDVIPATGPVGGIYSCLSASTTSHNLVISCDMPMINPGLIAFILSEIKDQDAVIPVFKGFIEPLCAYYNRRVSQAMLQAIESGIYKMQKVVKEISSKFVDIQPEMKFFDENLFANVNTLSELKLIEELLSPPSGQK